MKRQTLVADSNHDQQFTEVNKRLTCSLHKRGRDRNLYAAKIQGNEDTRVFMKSNDVMFIETGSDVNFYCLL